MAAGSTKRWCGACAKCAFTSLILSPRLSEDEALTILGQNMLNQDALMPFFESILGLSRHKPWDCVGTINESRAALWQLSQTAAWQNTKAVKTFLPKVLEQENVSQLRQHAENAMVPDGRGALPDHLYQAAIRARS